VETGVGTLGLMAMNAMTVQKNCTVSAEGAMPLIRSWLLERDTPPLKAGRKYWTTEKRIG
jgi:hypothetical protein